MKWLGFIIIVLFASCSTTTKVIGQVPQPTGLPTKMNSLWYQFTGYVDDSLGILLPVRDTNWLPRKPAFVFNPSDSLLYFHNKRKWTAVSSSTGNFVKYTDSLTKYVTPTQLKDSLDNYVTLHTVQTITAGKTWESTHRFTDTLGVGTSAPTSIFDVRVSATSSRMSFDGTRLTMYDNVDDDNILIGKSSGGSNLTSMNIGIGSSTVGNLTGGNNIAIGFGSQSSFGTVNRSTAVGIRSLQLSNGSDNTAYGYNAGVTTFGDSNTVVGSQASAALEIDDADISNSEIVIGTNTYSGTDVAAFITANSLQIGTRYPIFLVFNGGIPAPFTNTTNYANGAVTSSNTIQFDIALFTTQGGGTTTFNLYNKQVNSIAIGYQANTDSSNQISLGNINNTVLKANKVAIDIAATPSNGDVLVYSSTTGLYAPATGGGGAPERFGIEDNQATSTRTFDVDGETFNLYDGLFNFTTQSGGQGTIISAPVNSGFQQKLYIDQPNNRVRFLTQDNDDGGGIKRNTTGRTSVFSDSLDTTAPEVSLETNGNAVLVASNDQSVTLVNYGDGNYVAAPAYLLGVDANGKIIETLSGGSGSVGNADSLGGLPAVDYELVSNKTNTLGSSTTLYTSQKAVNDGLALKVDKTTTVNGSALSSNVNLVLASSQFANQGTSITFLKGNASGNPSWSSISLSTDVSGTLPIGSGGTGITSYATGDIIYYNGSALAKLPIGTSKQTLHVVGGVPAWRDTVATGGTPNVLTMNNSGSGAASGTTFDGSVARTISYNTIGAAPAIGSTSITTLGTITTGVWNGTAIANANLANSSITLQGSSVSLGGSVNVINGTGFVKATGTTISYDNSTYLTTASAASTYQPLDADLTAIAALSGTNNIYYRSAANTWSSVTVGSGLTFSGGTLAASGGGGGLNTTWQTVSYASNVNIDLSTGTKFSITLTGNINNLTFTNVTNGQDYQIEFIQDATGGRTVNFPTGTEFPLGVSIVARQPSLTTAGGAIDKINFSYNNLRSVYEVEMANDYNP